VTGQATDRKSGHATSRKKVGPVFRLLLVLLNLLTTDRPRAPAEYPARASHPRAGPPPAPAPRSRPPAHTSDLSRDGSAGRPGRDWPIPGRETGSRPGRRSRHPLTPWVKWTAAALIAGLIFRRAIASVVVMALSAVLHFAGLQVHLPHIGFAGPWVLQKIEGISRPALGQANFTFTFTHRVSKNIGPWPCWYASTFYAVAHTSATVDLNPGPAWWQASAGHYQLQVLSHPATGAPGRLAITMVLPRPQLPASVHDVTIDNVPSRPIDTQHSWTYPGFGCGVVIKPQFPESVLYAQAQQIAYYKARHAPMVTGPLVRAAESEAVQTIRDNFIQPTVNALGYTLTQFTLRWV
jgi:hypothetical protein